MPCMDALIILATSRHMAVPSVLYSPQLYTSRDTVWLSIIGCRTCLLTAVNTARGERFRVAAYVTHFASLTWQPRPLLDSHHSY
jgi:hypothetical protein